MIKRIMLMLGCAFLLLISWMSVINMRSSADKQKSLIVLADEEMRIGTYANAEPYLLEAITYNTGETFEVMEKLKEVYLNLDDARGYANVLKMQTSRSDCTEEVYVEYARYFLAQNKLTDALNVIKIGIDRTQAKSLVDFYEEHRYAFTMSKVAYADVTAYYNGGIQVKTDELWGISNVAGDIIIPCLYEQISTYDTANNGSIVALQTDNKLVAINLKNQVVAKTDLIVKQVGTLAQNIVPLQLTSGKWILADSRLIYNNYEYEDVGACANSAVAIQILGKWGLSSLKSKTILSYEYDGIVVDELGRCYAQNAVFARKDNTVYLFVDGKQLPETYEDARPFTDDGWAAVKINGKWGFIDTTGEMKIEPQFDDALSFSGHLAAVRKGELWGYVGLYGKIAIEPTFLRAKSFAYGYAPVLTELGWQFIALVEYSKGSGL